MFLISPFGSYYYPVSSSYSISTSVNTFTNVVRKQISSKLYSSPVKSPKKPKESKDDFTAVFGKPVKSDWDSSSCKFPDDTNNFDKVKEYADCMMKLSNSQNKK